MYENERSKLNIDFDILLKNPKIIFLYFLPALFEFNLINIIKEYMVCNGNSTE